MAVVLLLLVGILVASFGVGSPVNLAAGTASAATRQWANPVFPSNNGDPSILNIGTATDGYYAYAWADPEDDIHLALSPTIEGLAYPQESCVIFQLPDSSGDTWLGLPNDAVWSPVLAEYKGDFYLYFTAQPGPNAAPQPGGLPSYHSTYYMTLQPNANPCVQSDWSAPQRLVLGDYSGQEIGGNLIQFQGSQFQGTPYQNSLYYLFTGDGADTGPAADTNPGPTVNGIWIQPMSSPTQASGNPTLISTPTCSTATPLSATNCGLSQYAWEGTLQTPVPNVTVTANGTEATLTADTTAAVFNSSDVGQNVSGGFPFIPAYTTIEQVTSPQSVTVTDTTNNNADYSPASGLTIGVGTGVEEDPTYAADGDTLDVAFSANSFLLPAYSIGELVDANGGNPALASSWVKESTPLLQSADGVYGPGAPSFTTSPDGTQDWFLYSAKDFDSTNQANRHVNGQPFTFNSNGTLNLGSPIAVNVHQNQPSGESTVDPEQVIYDANNATPGGGATVVGATNPPDWEMLAGLESYPSSYAALSNYVAQLPSSGSSVTFDNVQVPRTQTYTLGVRTTNGNSGGGTPNGEGLLLSVTVNGTALSPVCMGPDLDPDSSAADAGFTFFSGNGVWTDEYFQAPLRAGSNTVEFSYNGAPCGPLAPPTSSEFGIDFLTVPRLEGAAQTLGSGVTVGSESNATDGLAVEGIDTSGSTAVTFYNNVCTVDPGPYTLQFNYSNGSTSTALWKVQATYADGQGAAPATTISLPPTLVSGSPSYDTFPPVDTTVWLDSGALTAATSLQFMDGGYPDLDQTEGCNSVTITPENTTSAYLDDLDWYGTSGGS